MKYFNSILIFFLIYISISCNRNIDVVRELHYVDLLNPENYGFNKYPDEFSSYILNGILNKNLKSFDIDYDSSGSVAPLDLNTFVSRILEPYEEYPADVNQYTNSYISEFLPAITLLSFDNIIADDKEVTAYINFYHPGEVTLEGFNKYICSVKYEEALNFLKSADPPMIWHNYKLKDWSWFNDRLFIPQFETASKLAFDMITLTDSADLISKLTDSSSYNRVKSLIKSYPYFLNSKFDTSGDGQLTILYKNDSVILKIAKFTFEDILRTAAKKEVEDSVIIEPVQTAIISNKLVRGKKTRRISKNGKFDTPLNGSDEISKNAPRDQNLDLQQFQSSQRFYFRTQERLIEQQKAIFNTLPTVLYEGVKNGEISVYRSDTLNIRLMPGEFFNNMILEELDNIPADTRYLELYQVITETVFTKSGEIISKTPVGAGLFLPGNQVPEGFNRLIGYFKTTEVNDYLKSKGKEEMPFSELKGYPLKSWNVEVVRL